MPMPYVILAPNPNGTRDKRYPNGIVLRATAEEVETWEHVLTLEAETAALREQVAGHAERIAAQSELLTRKAEKVEKLKGGKPAATPASP